MKKLQFGIIGCGRIGQRHAKEIEKCGDLIAVCDSIKEKADELASRHHAKAYYSINDFLQHQPAMDLVAVCTPNGLHAQHSIQALTAGCHVLCEKPMALNVQECEQMIQAATLADKQLFVVKQNRFNPPVAALKKIIDEGRLGKLYSFQLNCFWNRNDDYYHNSWKGTKELDGGTLYTQFSHFIDLLCWIGGDVQEAKAFTRNYAHQNSIEFEDTGVVLLQFENGMTGAVNYTVNSHTKNMEGSFTLFAEKGTVKIGGQYLNELEYQQIDNYRIDNLPAGNTANDYGHYQGSMSNHDKVYENVVQALQFGKPFIASAQDGLRTVKAIEKIYKAAASHE